MKDTWKDRYREAGYLYGKGPNDFFAQFIDTIPARKLLLPYAGDGRNAVYAAQYGWGVDAFDLSQDDIDAAKKLADDKYVSINYQNADLKTFHGEEDDYDLIALIHVQFSSEVREMYHRKLIKYLKKGGRIIIEAYGKEQPKKNSQLPISTDSLYSKDDLERDFMDLRIDMLQDRVMADENGGKVKVIHLVAAKS